MVRCRLPISSRPDSSAAAPAVPGAALGRLRAALFFVMGPSATRRLPREQASLCEVTMVARLFITFANVIISMICIFDKLVKKFANSQTQLEYVFANAHSHKLRYVCKRTKLRLQTHNGATHVCRNSRLQTYGASSMPSCLQT